MPKITLPSISSGYLSTEALNQAFEDIADAFDNTLSLDGSTPNSMSADLDMNGHSIINLVLDPDDPDSLATMGDVTDYIDTVASGLIVQRIETLTAIAAQTVFNFTEVTYEVGTNNLAVYVDGVRQFTPTYSETDSDTITFAAGLSAGQKVTVITNDFLATADLPTHSHPWSQLTNIPDTASRFPTYAEVTAKPTEFTPAAHVHSAADITTGRLADARRGVYVQATEPATPTTGDLWLW
jgi:hypothetical protein